MKYQVGDKVRIKSLDWYNSNKEKHSCKYFNFIEKMSVYCGMNATITEVNNNYYHIDIDKDNWKWLDYMFEETNIKERTIRISLDKAREWYKAGGDLKQVALQAYTEEELNDKFPKTWEECYKLLDEGEYISTNSEVFRIIPGLPINDYRNTLPVGLGEPMLSFIKLLVCREVYRQGWKPDWTDTNEKYSIRNFGGKLSKEHTKYSACILSFQSWEIRDKFLENFKDLLEQAKELI